jgi:energy-coupling factor transporter ATP-binding protein EcfA2
MPGSPGSVRGFAPGGSRRRTPIPSWPGGACWRSCTAGTTHRDGLPREPASRALDRYELARAAEQTFDSLSGGQQARFQILLLELSGATLLLLDEPTDNLDLHSAEALEEGLSAFEGDRGRRHPRPLVRPLVRPVLVFGADGRVQEHPEPVLGRGRVARER